MFYIHSKSVIFLKICKLVKRDYYSSTWPANERRYPKKLAEASDNGSIILRHYNFRYHEAENGYSIKDRSPNVNVSEKAACGIEIERTIMWIPAGLRSPKVVIRRDWGGIDRNYSVVRCDALHTRYIRKKCVSTQCDFAQTINMYRDHANAAMLMIDSYLCICACATPQRASGQNKKCDSDSGMEVISI